LALVAGLLALLLGGVGSGVPALALGPGLANAVMPDLRPGRTEAGTENLIPLNRQPFYPELLDASRRWADAPLGGVIGDNPRETLLNFYAVMTRVQRELSAATGSAARDPGVGWSSQAQARISTAEQLFALAVRALDGSAFPQSIRDDMTQEAAIQLKEVLDYVFTHSTVPIEIPDSAPGDSDHPDRHPDGSARPERFSVCQRYRRPGGAHVRADQGRNAGQPTIRHNGVFRPLQQDTRLPGCPEMVSAAAAAAARAGKQPHR